MSTATQQTEQREHQEEHKYREIRALYTPTTITVYQAYNHSIATAAVATQSLAKAPGFRRTRMTWIKPSFLWMAYRSGWATKTGQERVLAIEITRAGFEWALRNSCLSHVSRSATQSEIDAWTKTVKECPVRIQWDPERDLFLDPLGYRSIQVGVSGDAVDRYLDEWIVGIRDVTHVMMRVRAMVQSGDLDGARKEVPEERVYGVPQELRGILGAS